MSTRKRKTCSVCGDRSCDSMRSRKGQAGKGRTVDDMGLCELVKTQREGHVPREQMYRDNVLPFDPLRPAPAPRLSRRTSELRLD